MAARPQFADTIFRGRGKTLEAALDNAGKKALATKRGPHKLRLVELVVTVENPIVEYSVKLAPVVPGS